MKPGEKLLIATSILPVLADFLEDQEFNRFFKCETNNLIARIRKFDSMFMTGTDIEEIDQQNAIQRAFRQWAIDNFKLTEE